MKMKKKRKKFKIKKIISILVIILLIGIFIGWYKEEHIKNIYVIGNSILNEQTIIELAELEDYPLIYKVSSNKIEKRLLTSPFIKEVKVTTNLFGKVLINIKEYQVLYKDSINNNYVLSNGKSVNYDSDFNGLPVLINEVKDEVYNKFIESLKKIDTSIMLKISEIKYDPVDLDDERFLLYMTNQIYVYVTLDKIEAINSYNEIVPTLEGKKGILYLDSGNHFQIMK